MNSSYFILYVSDQATSTAFYSRVLDCSPRLNVPGMTEFVLPDGAILGLMPESGIRRLLGPRLPDPASAHGIPRAELYLLVEAPAAYMERALAAGAAPLSPLQPRDWGHRAAYCLDPDGHVLAFAADKQTPWKNSENISRQLFPNNKEEDSGIQRRICQVRSRTNAECRRNYIQKDVWRVCHLQRQQAGRSGL